MHGMRLFACVSLLFGELLASVYSSQNFYSLFLYFLEHYWMPSVPTHHLNFIPVTIINRYILLHSEHYTYILEVCDYLDK